MAITSIKEKYKESVIPALKKELGYKNLMAIPKMQKVSINVGLGSQFKDAKLLEVMENVLTRISGQKPVRRRARLSISNFKIREGNIIGMSVTLRGNRMYDFLDKLLNITFPRERDFQGLNPKSIDGQGNLSIGFKEYLAFPEIRSDEVERLHGLQITITTSAETKKEGLALFTALGFPFKKDIK